MKAPTQTSFSAGWKAARRSVRAGTTYPDMTNEQVRQVAAEQARAHMKKTMAARPQLTQRQGVAVFHSFFVAFLDSAIEEQFHRQGFPEFYG